MARPLPLSSDALRRDVETGNVDTVDCFPHGYAGAFTR